MTKAILLVEDEPTSQELVKYLLEERGHKVLVASNGESGWEMALKHAPDLIILDVMMPKMSGVSLCERLKGDARFSRVPVLFLSALGQREEVAMGLKAGGNGYIVKPFEPREFQKKVEEMLR